MKDGYTDDIFARINGEEPAAAKAKYWKLLHTELSLCHGMEVYNFYGLF
jgi:hypothetical protein